MSCCISRRRIGGRKHIIKKNIENNYGGRGEARWFKRVMQTKYNIFELKRSGFSSLETLQQGRKYWSNKNVFGHGNRHATQSLSVCSFPSKPYRTQASTPRTRPIAHHGHTEDLVWFIIHRWGGNCNRGRGFIRCKKFDLPPKSGLWFRNPHLHGRNGIAQKRTKNPHST